MSIQHFSHLGICVSSLDRSIAFYTQVLGFVEVSRTAVGAEVGPLIEMDAPEIQLRSHFLERDHMRLELMEFDAPPPSGTGERGDFNRLGLTHLAVRVSDVGEALAKVTEYHGVVLEHTRVGQADMGVELIYITDPDGVRIELIQLPGDPSVAPGEPV
ncbi:Catechol-2,3-dioxygenase [Halioglobus japonicus]|nr:Catechol-2,3-dioxygenase [Halioglobus japonicus]